MTDEWNEDTDPNASIPFDVSDEPESEGESTRVDVELEDFYTARGADPSPQGVIYDTDIDPFEKDKAKKGKKASAAEADPGPPVQETATRAEGRRATVKRKKKKKRPPPPPPPTYDMDGESSPEEVQALLDASNPDDMALNALGPAFPEGTGDLRAHGTINLDDLGDDSASASRGNTFEFPAEDSDYPSEDRPAFLNNPDMESATNARPMPPAPPPDAHEPLPRPPQDDQPEEDLWADFDESSQASWGSYSGPRPGGGGPAPEESQRVRPPRPQRPDPVEQESEPSMEPPRKGAGGEYVRRNTDRYGPDGKPKSAASEELARLVCSKGADSGQEFGVGARELVIGRSTSCDITLKEPSVSREHARISYDGSQFSLIDQRSGNGTFVNGKKVDRARIRSGDEVGFGNGKFRFLEVGDVFKPVDASGAPVLPGAAPSGDRRSLRVGLIVGGVLVAAGLMAALFLASRNTKDAPNRDLIFSSYLQGVESFKQRKWDDAEQRFGLLLKLDPGHARGQAYAEAISREREFETRLMAAQASLAKQDLVGAYTLASSIRDSMMEAEAREVMDTVERKVLKRKAQARVALRDGQVDSAAKYLTAVESINPRDQEARIMMARVRASLGAEAPEPEVREAPAPPSAESSKAAKEARTLFGKGQIDKAVKLLEGTNSSEAKQLRASIDSFTSIYEDALRAESKEKLDSAVKSLTKAYKIASSITGGGSALEREVGRRLGKLYFKGGSQQETRGRLADAYRLYEAALASDPGHVRARKHLEAILTQANDLFRAGYVAKDADPGRAKNMLRRVLEMLPSNHDLYKKAKQQLDAL